MKKEISFFHRFQQLRSYRADNPDPGEIPISFRIVPMGVSVAKAS